MKGLHVSGAQTGRTGGESLVAYLAQVKK